MGVNRSARRKPTTDQGLRWRSGQSARLLPLRLRVRFSVRRVNQVKRVVNTAENRVFAHLPISRVCSFVTCNAKYVHSTGGDDLPFPFRYMNMLSRRLETSLENECMEIFQPVLHWANLFAGRKIRRKNVQRFNKCTSSILSVFAVFYCAPVFMVR